MRGSLSVGVEAVKVTDVGKVDVDILFGVLGVLAASLMDTISVLYIVCENQNLQPQLYIFCLNAHIVLFLGFLYQSRPHYNILLCKQ